MIFNINFVFFEIQYNKKTLVDTRPSDYTNYTYQYKDKQRAHIYNTYIQIVNATAFLNASP